MDLILEFYNALCETFRFSINGVVAKHEDFGDKYDRCPDDADYYCCGNMVFTPKTPTSEILNKYNISVDEYNEICHKLEDGLSFGACGWCL